MDRLNRRHPWNHNDHYHRWILAHLPGQRSAALDVGCGHGILAEQLAGRFERVTAVDTDAGMVGAAEAYLAHCPNVLVRQAGFDEIDPAAGRFDLITMIAVLHHLELEPALRRARELLTPGGRLLVVGLARPDGLPDLTVNAVSSVANPLVGLVKHPRRAGDGDAVDRPGMPVKHPDLSYDEIAAAARRALPGVTLHRRLFFRYTLLWQRPWWGSRPFRWLGR